MLERILPVDTQRLSNALALQLRPAGFIAPPVAHSHGLVSGTATVGLVRFAHETAGSCALGTPSLVVHSSLPSRISLRSSGLRARLASFFDLSPSRRW